MLKRVHIKGYKSFQDTEVQLEPLSVLFGPNAAGKSNFLDALQILSKLGASRTIKEAFDFPCRGKPIESFSVGKSGFKGLRRRQRLVFSIEVDLHLSDAVVNAVNRQIQEMRRSNGRAESSGKNAAPSPVRERDLRYRVAIEMLPKAGILRVADEYLAALNKQGQPTGRRSPFIERRGDKIHLRFEGQAHPAYHDRYLDHTVLSMPHYPPHYPHLVAARREMDSWLFFYFEPRERMREPSPVKEVRHIGLMGEELAACLRTLQALHPRQFRAVEKALHMLIPDIDGIEVDVNDLGEAELRLRKNGGSIPARVLSEGTLRMLGLLALQGVGGPPSLVGLEEPENGVHPARIRLISELLKTRAQLGETQYIVATHSPTLLDLLPGESLFPVSQRDGRTRIDAFSTWGPLGPRRRSERIREAWTGESVPPVSQRVLRGDFD